MTEHGGYPDQAGRSGPTDTQDWPAWPPPPPLPPVGRPPDPAPPAWRARWWVLVLAAMVVAFGIGFAVTESRSGTPSVSRPVAPAPGTTVPQGPTDRAAGALTALGVQQADVGAQLSVGLIPGGDRVAGETTLDLCNAAYPSESLRTARLQVAVTDQQGNLLLGTEAVLYRDSAATVQAFAELRSAAAHCPDSPVVSPVGEPTVVTHFLAAPDVTWPQTPGVERLAFDFTTTGASGQANRAIAVYLRRGRALLGIYFQSPGTQPAVAGQTTIPGIVNVLAVRMQRLPASATS